MKKLALKISILITTTFLSLNSVYAHNIGKYFADAKAANFDPQNLKDMIFTILTYIGWAIAICVVLITGIQFLTANASKKAQLKEKLWLIILGVFLLAGGIPILQAIGNLFLGFRATLIDNI